MKNTSKFFLTFGIGLMISASPALQAQDILGELKNRCDQVGGILDEDFNCIDPIVVDGGGDKIELSDVELSTQLRTSKTSSRTLTQQINLIEQPPLIHADVGNLGDIGDINTNITQQEGLRLCFAELEVDVRNCQYAFQNNVEGYNECVTMAGDSYQGCLTWVQKLPYEENQN